ncbi:TPA: hypothetical protein PMD71_002816 [Vibrio cholerae]|nr:hypothetical protein [Vibrio cholerae]
MRKVEVNRDERGFWRHPQLPAWGENTSLEHAKAWFSNFNLDCEIVIMDGELGEKWGSGKIESCIDWEPCNEIKDSFLVGIWDTEDGVVAMLAFPLIVFEDSPEAAQYKTGLSGWVSRDGRFYGNNEELAKYAGSTHKKCKCGEIIPKSSYCYPCHEKKEIENFFNMPIIEWDGSDMLYDQNTDKYFSDIEDIHEHYELEGMDVKEAMIIVCKPNYAREIESDYWCDDLPQDMSFEENSAVDDETLDLLNKLNAKLKKTVLSYSPGNKRINILSE